MEVTEIKHWSEIGDNPISAAAMQFVKEQLQAKYAGPLFEVQTFWESSLKGKSLLDIGVVEHSIEFIDQDRWKHRKLRDLAAKTVGVDIVPDAVAKLVDDGYDVRLCDATSDEDLNERFDVVNIGDVIEHVNDPVLLLKFAARHIKPGGQIIVTTPCPFWWRNIRLMTLDSTHIGNLDHVCWICPAHALELGHRANIVLANYHTIETEANSLLKKLMHGVARACFGKTELFTWTYLYVFRLDD